MSAWTISTSWRSVEIIFSSFCVYVCACVHLCPCKRARPPTGVKFFKNHLTDRCGQRSSATSEISTFYFLCFAQHSFYYFPRCHFLCAYHCLRTWRQCCGRHGDQTQDQMTAVANFWLDLRLVVVWGHCVGERCHCDPPPTLVALCAAHLAINSKKSLKLVDHISAVTVSLALSVEPLESLFISLSDQGTHIPEWEQFEVPINTPACFPSSVRINSWSSSLLIDFDHVQHPNSELLCFKNSLLAYSYECLRSSLYWTCLQPVERQSSIFKAAGCFAAGHCSVRHQELRSNCFHNRKKHKHILPKLNLRAKVANGQGMKALIHSATLVSSYKAQILCCAEKRFSSGQWTRRDQTFISFYWLLRVYSSLGQQQQQQHGTRADEGKAFLKVYTKCI